MRNEEQSGRKQRGLLSITVGLLLIAAALFLASYNLYDELRAEQSARQAVTQLDAYLPAEAAPEAPSDSARDQEPLVSDERTVIPDYVLSPNMEMPVETINGIDFIGVLRIPALELELPVISEWNYPNLKSAPCRYSGSAYLNNLILCGHNYASHFGSLKTLSEGDIATFTDIDGNVFIYKMVERETLNPTDIEGMESGNWDLTLFTCTVGGRLIPPKIETGFRIGKLTVAMPTGHEKTAIPSGTVSVTAMVPLNWIPAPSSGPYRDKIQTACRLPWFLPTPRFGRRSVYTLTQSIVTTDSQTIAAKLNGEYIRAKNNNQRLSILGSRSAYHGTKLHYHI